ncbi:putative Ran-binding protein 17 [Paratrimastix pyriformis]|uniref:Ran-binding protein 17 n=1 Tax=Paratrimastix pyriformis TaxID=342808 RepID=A0ABQ8UNV5_9EUKA|nr:putative Ran-binding protein 17 [Paratrimastix pyriformis]
MQPRPDTLALLAQGKVGIESLKEMLPAERWPDLLGLLQQPTSQPPAILFAAKNLTKIFTENWNLFSAQQRTDIRTFMMNYLYTKGAEFSSAAIGGHDPSTNSALIAVLQSLVQLLCRLSKLTWIDEKERDISISEFSKFFEASVDHCIVGLNIFHELIREINYNAANFSLTEHRKIQISFRNDSLYKVLNLAVSYLTHVCNNSLGAQATPQHVMAICAEALNVSLACLSFDFIGTNPEDSVEDIGTVHFPLVWRPLMEEANVIDLFFRLYSLESATLMDRSKARPTPHAPRPRALTPCTPPFTLQCIAQLVSVRRSIFTNNETRNVFLERVLVGTLQIMKSERGLDDSDTFHQLCRVLMRTKANFLLDEITVSPSYPDWIQHVSRLTYTAFRFWRWSANSLYYLLTLWSRIVLSSPSYPAAATPPSAWEQAAPEIAKAYVETRMYIAEAVCQEESIDDPLENDEMLQQQMQAVPSLIRFRYQPLAEYIASLLDPRITRYKVPAHPLAPLHTRPSRRLGSSV